MRVLLPIVLAAAAAVVLATVAAAEFTPPWKDKRVASPNGKHTVDAKRVNEGIRLTLGETSGVVKQMPFGIHVLDDGSGVVLFEKYGHLGHGDTLALFGADAGKIQWRRRLPDLFAAEEIAAFPKSDDQIRWFHAWWVEGDHVVLLAKGGLLREVSVADGKVASQEKVEVLDYLERAGLRPEASKAALRALGRMGKEGVPAMVYLLSHGDASKETRELAAKALKGMPKDAVLKSVLREMRDADAQLGGTLLRAAVATGAADLPARVQRYEQTLLKVLEHETFDVGWLADYFATRPTTEALQPLLKALKKHRYEPALRDRILRALKPCSGLDFGNDVDAWLRELRR